MTERPVRTAPARRIASLAIAAVIFIAACETRLPTSAEVENMNAASAVEYTKAAVPDTRSPQYVINGKVADKKSAETLRPEEIAAINVLKGTAGSPDQIRIATLSAAATVEPSILDKSGRSSTTASTIRLKGAGTPAGFDGLLIVDGEIVSASYLNSLSPDRIASMEVLKSAAATTQYNDARAANGVIRITTKR